MDSLKGRLLISAGDMPDLNFRHTVVLVGEHDEEGAVGIVLNRPLELTVTDAVPALAELAGPDEVLFRGGPVEPAQAVLMADVTDPSLLDVPVVGSLGFLTGEVSGEIRPAVRRARVYVGHAGWGPGQLEGELEGESWIIDDARPEDVFTPDPGGLWRRVLERKGPEYAAVARIPFDPTMN